MIRRTHRRQTVRRRRVLFLDGLEERAVPSSSALMAATGGLNSVNTSGTTSAAEIAAMPTRHEMLRQRFVAKFKGPFVVGKPRFKDQVSQTYLFGGGTSTAFLHGDLQLAFAIPRDPAQPIDGQANMTVKNVSNTGNELIVDLVADPTSLDRAGRPTRFTWTQNPSSGGIFTNGNGSGTLEVQYRPGGKLPLRASSAGTVGVIFRGTIFTTGLSDTLRNQ
jgi:hypothetical protein